MAVRHTVAEVREKGMELEESMAADWMCLGSESLCAFGRGLFLLRDLRLEAPDRLCHLGPALQEHLPPGHQARQLHGAQRGGEREQSACQKSMVGSPTHFFEPKSNCQAVVLANVQLFEHKRMDTIFSLSGYATRTGWQFLHFWFSGPGWFLVRC